MAVTINTTIDQIYTWGNYGYITWGGSEDITWGTAYNYTTSLLDTNEFGITDTHRKLYGKLGKEQISVEEYLSRDGTKLVREGFRTADEYSRIVITDRYFCEDVYVDELKSIRPSKVFEEDIVMVADWNTNDFTLVPTEPLVVTDVLRREFDVIRQWDENIDIVESNKNKTELFKVEDSVKINDSMLRASGGVISNIYITEGAYSMEQFSDAIDIPPGFTKFVDFKVGEYEYEEALVRISLAASNQSEPTAAGVTMHVDIPDTDDRGTAQITDTSGPTKVYLNKPFYIVPEIQVTLRNGTTGSGYVTPNLVSVDGKDEYGRFFMVELRTSSGARATGTISWVAKGY